MLKTAIAVALLCALSSGVEARSYGALKNKTMFPTVEACKAYFETEAGQQAKSAIDDLIKAQEGALVAEMACMKADAKTDDGSI